MERPPRVVIAGGGIGGLTAALACHHVGLAPEVYERAESARETGAGIQLGANAVRVLHALGLREALAEIGHQPEGIELRNARSGFLIAHLPLGGFAEQRYGAPYYQLHRGALHALLTATARSRRIPIHYGRHVDDFEQDAAGVDVILHSGARTRAEVLVGADGLASRVQARMLGERPPRFTGNVAWRMLVPAEALPRRPPPVAMAWLGPRAHFVHYYVDGGARINCVAVVETERWTDESWSTPGDPEEMRGAFTQWHPLVRSLLDATGSCWRWALYERPPLPRWSAGRVTLLGDACHPMLPFLAQGAAMAIEDAWALAQLLEQYDEAVEEALEHYQRVRRPRTARVQRQARDQGRMFHLASPWARLRRNLVLGFGSRFVPDIAMGRFDWLYGYDPVRRFA